MTTLTVKNRKEGLMFFKNIYDILVFFTLFFLDSIENILVLFYHSSHNH